MRRQPPTDGDHISAPPYGSDPAGAAGPLGRGGDGIGRWLLSLRVPAWLALAVAVLVAALFTLLLVSEERVDLGSAVDGAVEASVSLTICNETVDRRQMNPRVAELAFEEGLEDLGVKQANVVVMRIDCGADAS